MAPPHSVAIGDLNGDGKPELATVNNMDTTVSILRNNGDGTFATKVDYPSEADPRGIAIGDLNGDGKGDLAVTSVNADVVSVLMNNGNGTFATKVNYTTGLDPYIVVIADLDGDGKADLASANTAGESVSVFQNNGNGTFATKVDYPTASTSYSVAVGDLNGDGKADLAATNHNSTSVSVFMNDVRTILYAASGTGGRVGIGTSTPAERLTPSGNILISTDTATSTINPLKIVTDVTSNNNTVFRINASGATFADQPYSTSGADYAEWFLTDDRGVTHGEVVCIDVMRANTVKRCDRAADPNVMGIISSRPAFIGNTISGADGIMPPGYVLVGLIGQVPAKVKVESGAVIRPGDSLTPATTPGVRAQGEGRGADGRCRARRNGSAGRNGQCAHLAQEPVAHGRNGRAAGL